MQFNRRYIVGGLAAAGVVAAGGGLLLARNHPATAGNEDAVATGTQGDEPTRATLEDIALGDPDAPVRVIEYASLTCGHCAHFHETTFPALKERYVETGKVHFIMREFPLDRLALAAAVMARCAGEKRYFAILDMLFSQQGTWARAEDPISALARIGKLGGLSKDEFDACMQNKALIDHVVTTRYDAQEAYEINSTPSFIVKSPPDSEGEKYSGALSIEEFEKILTPLLAKA